MHSLGATAIAFPVPPRLHSLCQSPRSCSLDSARRFRVWDPIDQIVGQAGIPWEVPIGQLLDRCTNETQRSLRDIKDFVQQF